MDKQDIINYVLETPTNTNPAVLSGMLDSISGGGSGGNSDLTTAIVDLTLILPDDKTVSTIKEAYINVVDDNLNYIITFYYSDVNGLPTSELGTVSQLNIPIYKTYKTSLGTDTYFSGATGIFAIDFFDSATEVLSGNAILNSSEGCFIISGNCALKIALNYID